MTSSIRQERQIKNLERGLLAGGSVMLLLTMSMTFRFGWGLGHDDLNRLGFGLFYSGADFIGALFMAGVGVLFAWRWYAAGTFVLLATVLCIGFSMVTLFGFQSSNRTAVTLNYEAQKKQADKRLDWLRGLTIDKNMSKDRPNILEEERKQYQDMQKSEADPDAQASEVAKVLGIEKDEAQRRLNMGASAFILFLQFTCLSLRSFFRHRVAPAISSAVNGPANVQNPRRLERTLAKLSATEAKSDVLDCISRNEEFCVTEYAERWGVNKGQASTWLSDFQREGVIKLVKRGNRLVAVAPNILPFKGKGSGVA